MLRFVSVVLCDMTDHKILQEYTANMGLFWRGRMYCETNEWCDVSTRRSEAAVTFIFILRGSSRA